MSGDSTADVDELREVIGEEPTDEAEDEETSVAEGFGTKVGIPVALVAFYAVFVGPDRLFKLSSEAGELLTIRSGDGVEPLLLVSAATLLAAFVGGVVFTMTADELEEDYRSELAMGVLFPPVAVVLFAVLIAVLEPVANLVLAGSFLEATVLFVIEAVVIAIAIGSSIGILAAMVVFGVYFGIPSYVGVYAGSLLGRLGRTARPE